MSKVVFLTSDPGTQYIENQEGLNADNNFIENLKKYWKDNANVLLVSSDPYNDKMNEECRNFIKESFPLSGLSVENVDICNDSHRDLAKHLDNYDFILLAGGHVPTENKFFKEIELKKEIEKFDGIVLGISAGTMNCASTVYAMPELEGESIDPEYKRYISGLGLTDINIIPHYQYLKGVMLDGSNMIDDIACSDSMGKKFYGVVDGAYVMIENGEHTLYGEGYIIENGNIQKICSKGNTLNLSV